MAVYTSNSLGSLLVTALKYTVGAGIVAAIINAILFLVVGIPADQVVDRGNGAATETIGLMNVVMGSIIPTVIAGIVFAVIAKFVPKPFLVFNIIALLIFLFTFFGPLNSIPKASNSTLILLEVMHVVVGCAVLYALNNMWGAPEDTTTTV
jgi:Family of unknown function (DUF6069)